MGGAEILAKIGDISLIVYILHPLIIRPFDKVAMKIAGSFMNPIYFIGIIMGVFMTLLICFNMQKIFKFLRVL